MVKQRFFLLFLLMDITILSYCQKAIIWQKDGSKTYFNLSDNPKSTFTLTDLVISTSKMTVNYPLNKVLRFTYDLTPTEIDNPILNESNIIIQDNDQLILYNFPAGTNIYVYGIDGKQLINYKVNGDQKQIVSIKDLPNGIYVVKANNISYKVIKR